MNTQNFGQLPVRTPSTHRYDRDTGQYVMRKPYYYCDDLIPYLLPHPWHYIFFSQLRIYRFFVGGVWRLYEGFWVRMENRRDNEYCNEHCEIEPCCYCKAENELYE